MKKAKFISIILVFCILIGGASIWLFAKEDGSLVGASSDGFIFAAYPNLDNVLLAFQDVIDTLLPVVGLEHHHIATTTVKFGRSTI